MLGVKAIFKIQFLLSGAVARHVLSTNNFIFQVFVPSNAILLGKSFNHYILRAKNNSRSSKQEIK